MQPGASQNAQIAPPGAGRVKGWVRLRGLEKGRGSLEGWLVGALGETEGGASMVKSGSAWLSEETWNF